MEQRFNVLFNTPTLLLSKSEKTPLLKKTDWNISKSLSSIFEYFPVGVLRQGAEAVGQGKQFPPTQADISLHLPVKLIHSK